MFVPVKAEWDIMDYFGCACTPSLRIRFSSFYLPVLLVVGMKMRMEFVLHH